MRVNFHKSELIAINLEAEEANSAAVIFNCPLGSFLLKYLEVPLHYENLTREDLQPLVDKLLNRMAGWRGKLLSLAARALLIKSCLARIPVYLLSVLKFPKWAIKILNSHMGNSLWNNSKNAHNTTLPIGGLWLCAKSLGAWGSQTLEISISVS